MEPWNLTRFPAIAEEDESYTVKTPYGPHRFIRQAGQALHAAREPLEVFERTRKVNTTSLANTSKRPLLLGAAWLKSIGSRQTLPWSFQ